MVLSVVVVFSVAAMTYLTTTTVRATGANNLLLASRARYLAESGVQHAIYLLRAKPELMAGRTSEASALGPYYADGTQDWYKFHAAPDGGNPLIYTIYAFSSVDRARGKASCRVKLSSKFAAKVQAYGPSFWWRLGDSGLTAANQVPLAQSGTYTNGTLRGQPGAIIGETNKAATFDGMDDYVDLQTMDLLAGGSFTMMAWVKLLSPIGGDGRFLCKATGFGDNVLWKVGTTVSNGQAIPVFGLKADGKKTVTGATTDSLTVGEWALIAGSYDRSYMRLYRNNVQCRRTPQSGDVATGSMVRSWIGANPPTATFAPFHGQIDEVMIFPRALTVQEIGCLYKARVASVEVLSWDE
jgi:hypothetical protein